MSSTSNWLGVRVPRGAMVRRRSISRVSRRPISTGCKPPAEGPGEHALDHALEAPLELLESHGVP